MKFKKLKIDFKDDRGTIMDIFYKKNIQHVAIIKSKPNVEVIITIKKQLNGCLLLKVHWSIGTNH